MVTQFDDTVCAEPELFGPRSHSDENRRWMWALFSTSMATINRRTHARLLLHLAGFPLLRIAHNILSGRRKLRRAARTLSILC